MTHYAFRDTLVDLVRSQLAKLVQKTGEFATRSMSKKQWSADNKRRIGQHWAVKIAKPDGQRVEGKKPGSHTNRNWLRGHCMMCSKLSDHKCEQCKVYLCTKMKGNQTTCFKEFHQLPSFNSEGSTGADDGEIEEA